jgi:pimeloyl-ACP methyl ester carboxylesterase
MDVVLWVVAVALMGLVVWLLAVAFPGMGVPDLPQLVSRPAMDHEHAMAALARLTSADGPEVTPAARTQLLSPQGAARGTIIVWHGFTNCPAQFAEVAEILCAEGYFVLVARIPRHGNSDTLTRDLEELAVEELGDFCDACVDAAAGLPGPLMLIGFSVGGTLAAWTAATRAEIERVVAISPMIAPVGVPMSLERLIVRFRGLMPATWIWWDPRKKEQIGGSPHVYPGFPMTGLIPLAHIGVSLHDRRVVTNHRLRSVTLISNPLDTVVRNGPARAMATRVFAGHADTVEELMLDRSLGWSHDFIDQYGSRSADPEQVAQLLLAAMGQEGATVPAGVVGRVVELDEGILSKK